MIGSVMDRETQDIVLNMMSELTKEGHLFSDLLKQQIGQSIFTLIKSQFEGQTDANAAPLKAARPEPVYLGGAEDRGKTAQEVSWQ